MSREKEGEEEADGGSHDRADGRGATEEGEDHKD